MNYNVENFLKLHNITITVLKLILSYRNKDAESDDSSDLVVIDLQMSRIGSPASDILYCLGSSTSLESRKAYLQEWLQLYHKVLLEDLVTFGYSTDIFKYENFLDEINHLWPFALESGVFHAEVSNKEY